MSWPDDAHPTWLKFYLKSVELKYLFLQEVGIWWVQKRFPRYGVPIWSLWPNIKFLPLIVAEKNVTNVFILYKRFVFIPPLPGGGRGYTVLPLSVLPSVPRYFSSHFFQQLLMAEIWYLVGKTVYPLRRGYNNNPNKKCTNIGKFHLEYVSALF
jgi:hypothetical protein